MSALGSDFQGGLWRRLYAPGVIAPLWMSIGIAVALLVINQLLQAVCGIVIMHTLFAGAQGPGELVKAYMIGLFPASVLTAILAWTFAGLKGRPAAQVLSLRAPAITPAGWLVLVLGFLFALYLAIIIVVSVSGIDLAQYAPVEGEDNSSTVGIVKQAMFDLAHDPKLFLLVLPSVTLGAPLAEELIFRGQLFNGLANSRAGVSGATLLTALGWAAMHLTEPLFSMGLIFVMGLVFGYFLYRFGSLWVTIVCHAVWNAIYSLIIFGSIGS